MLKSGCGDLLVSPAFQHILHRLPGSTSLHRLLGKEVPGASRSLDGHIGKGIAQNTLIVCDSDLWNRGRKEKQKEKQKKKKWSLCAGLIRARGLRSPQSLQFLFNLGGADDDLYRLYDYIGGGDSTAPFHRIYGADGDSIHVNIHVVAELY
jgi:hypothetical protein